VFPLDELGSDLVLTEKLCPVGAQVNPSGFRVLGNEKMGGADVAPAVQWVPLGHGKLVKVNVIAGQDVFLARSCGFVDLLGRDQGFTQSGPGSIKVHQAGIQGLAHDEGTPFCCRTNTRHHRCVVVLYVLKQQGRPARLFVQFRDVRELEIPVHFRCYLFT